MYVVIVARLLLNRWLNDVRQQTTAEALVNAASTAADGLIHGLTEPRRAEAQRQLRRAAADGVDPAAIALALFSTAGVVNAVVTLSEDLSGGTGTDITTIGQMCGSVVAFLLCWTAISQLRTGRIWPVRMLRAAALVTILLTEVFNFVAEEFGALINVAVGLTALVVFSRRITVLERGEHSTNHPNGDPREAVPFAQPT